MKDIQSQLIRLFKEGYCTPQIARIARTIKEPSATIHYNIKKLEQEGVIKTYKGVFDHKKIDEGFCAYVLISLPVGEYGNPEKVALELTKHEEVESVDIISGTYDLIMKIRTKDSDSYHEFHKTVFSEVPVGKTETIISLKQLKTEYVPL